MTREQRPMLSAPYGAPPRRPTVTGFEDIACAWDTKLGHWCAKILPGEFYITRSKEVITTVLGSCISACIRDPVADVGGMNHFLLPEDTTQGRSSWLDADAGLATRYGSFAMESLINGLLKVGARRERLEVKLVGGGRILNIGFDVGERNIEFAHRWLRLEGYTLLAEDVGQSMPRRVVYFPATGKVRVKHLPPLACIEIARREQQYLRTTVVRPAAGNIEMF
jgi:chemotaxis protein CheD